MTQQNKFSMARFMAAKVYWFATTSKGINVVYLYLTAVNTKYFNTHHQLKIYVNLLFRAKKLDLLDQLKGQNLSQTSEWKQKIQMMVSTYIILNAERSHSENQSNSSTHSTTIHSNGFY